MYNKLVRDLVPPRIRAKGATVVSHIAKAEELREKIGFKLDEEIGEFATAKNPEELIDVMEVVNAIEALGKHGRPSLESIAQWIGTKPDTKDEDEKDDFLLQKIYELNDAATEYIVSRSDKAFGGLVIALEALIQTTGFDRDTLEAMRRNKLASHGGFEFGIILDSVADEA